MNKEIVCASIQKDIKKFYHILTHNSTSSFVKYYQDNHGEYHNSPNAMADVFLSWFALMAAEYSHAAQLYGDTIKSALDALEYIGAVIEEIVQNTPEENDAAMLVHIYASAQLYQIYKCLFGKYRENKHVELVDDEKKITKKLTAAADKKSFYKTIAASRNMVMKA